VVLSQHTQPERVERDTGYSGTRGCRACPAVVCRGRQQVYDVRTSSNAGRTAVQSASWTINSGLPA